MDAHPEGGEVSLGGESRRGPGAGEPDPALSRRLGAGDVVGIAVGCVALALAFARFAGARDLWYDEMATRTLVADPSLGHMLAAIADGAENNPPLYHILMRGWAALAGTSALALRLPTLLAFCAAFAVTWIGARRVWSVRAVAVGTLAAFAGSQTLLWTQIANARFYGVFFLLASVALVLGGRAAANERSRLPLLSALLVANVAMIYASVFGLLFSGALAAGTAVIDLRERRGLRVRALLPYVLSWLAFVPWVPTMLHQAELAKPHSWIAVPTLGDLAELMVRDGMMVPVVLIVLLALHLRGARTDAVVAAPDPDAARQRRASVVLSIAYLCVPALLFAQSRVSMSVFVPRYVLPTVLGWAFVLAELAERTFGRDPGPAKRPGATLPALAAVLAIAIVAVAYVPAAGKRVLPGYPPKGAVGPEPIVFEDGLAFWPLLQFEPSARPNVVYLLDSASAFTPQSARAPIQEFKLMRLYATHGYMGTAVQPSDRFLCEHARFYVVDNSRFPWFERHVAGDPSYAVTTVGQTSDGALRLVERRPATRAAGCPASPPA